MNPLPFSGPGTTRALQVVAGLAAVAFLVGVPLAPERTWPAFLVSGLLLAGLAVGGSIFLALNAVTGARWSLPIRAVPEAMVSALPWAGALLLLVALGLPTLYPWADAATVHGDRVLEGRSPWMNAPMFLVRMALCFALWMLLSRSLLRSDPAKRGKAAALFLVVFGVTFSSATFDWVMSLERHWFSTILAIYHFSGTFLSALAAITILVVLGRRRGWLASVVSEETLHDLGKLLFGFSLFWGYIWFSQYLLIWYVNSPEEIPYYLVRHSGAWAPLSAVNVLLNWTIPFVVLLPRRTKRSEAVLLRVAVLLLVGRWLDLWLAVVPSHEATPVVSVWDALLPAGALALFVLLWRRAAARPAPVTQEDRVLRPSHA